MKKLILLLSLLILFTLSACEEEPIDETNTDQEFEYSDLSDIALTSHDQAENMSNNKYIVYYYSATCSHCQEVKQDILGFASEYEDVDFYIFDVSDADDRTSIEEFLGTPSVLIFSGGELTQIYLGKIRVIDFIEEYTDQILTYDTFETQHLTTYQEVLDINTGVYLLYYYLVDCPNCIAIKDQFLSWAFTKSVHQIYFMNGMSVSDPDNIPTELQILASGTPLLLVMNNGIFTDEYYSNSEDISEYIELIGASDID